MGIKFAILLPNVVTNVVKRSIKKNECLVHLMEQIHGILVMTLLQMFEF